jgi:hypothetical protein
MTDTNKPDQPELKIVPDPSTAFEFLSPLDGKTYTLPPYDPEKFVDEVGTHFESVPKISLSEALLADDPLAGLESLNEPARALNVLMKAAIVKTLRKHLKAKDPAWLALRTLIDKGEFDVLGKVFFDWQKFYGAAGVDVEGED